MGTVLVLEPGGRPLGLGGVAGDDPGVGVDSRFRVGVAGAALSGGRDPIVDCCGIGDWAAGPGDCGAGVGPAGWQLKILSSKGAEE